MAGIHLYLSFEMPVQRVKVSVSSIAGSLCFRTLKHQAEQSTVWEALRPQFHVKAVPSPQLAHQVWDGFVNTRKGLGRNIQNDLYNEYIV